MKLLKSMNKTVFGINLCKVFSFSHFAAAWFYIPFVDVCEHYVRCTIAICYCFIIAAVLTNLERRLENEYLQNNS